MKQNKQRGSAIWFSVLLVTILSLMCFLALIWQKSDIERLKKHDTCLTQAITELPDPNDTTERTLLLTECMDK